MISHTLIEVDFTINALKAKKYLVRLSHKQKPIIEQLLEPDKLRSQLEYFLEKNNEGYNVFFRPQGLQYVLLNRLTPNDLSKLRKFHPCTLVETWKMTFQAWLRFKEIPHNLNDARMIYRELETHFPSCITSYMDDNFGRLPGFFNRDESCRNAKGFYPLVEIQQHKNQDCNYPLNISFIAN